VKFKAQVEYMPEYEEDEEFNEAPRIIKLEEMEEEWSP
jgi:hypothetical protein